MKIAVVGGRGFIGKEFVAYAEEKGHDAVVIGSDCDVFSDAGAAKACHILNTCEAMVFLAAKRPTNEFTVTEYIYNVRLAERYLSLANEAGITNVALTSSRSVYSNMIRPWKEDELKTPLSLYGASKLAVDSIALLYNEQYGMNIKSLRLAQVIGMGEHKGFLLNTLIDNAAAGKKQTIYGKGIGRRQYIYVKDVCDALLHSVVSEKAAKGIYNIGMDCNVSIVELAETINNVFDNSAGMEMFEDKPEDTNEYLMDVSKAERELHWKPHYDLRETFVDIRDNCLQN